MKLLATCALALGCCATPCAAGADIDASVASDLARGVGERQVGNVGRSIDLLSGLHERAVGEPAKARVAAELGAALLQAHRLDEAAIALNEARAGLSGPAGARVAIDLGNLSVYRKQPDEALRLYREAVALAGADEVVVLIAQLNMARVGPPSGRLSSLASLARRMESVSDRRSRARMLLNLGQQAQASGEEGAALAYRSIFAARSLAADSGDGRLEVESLDALAQIYEDRDRGDEAVSLSRQALERSRGLDSNAVVDLLPGLEWRVGRWAVRSGQDDLALASYQRAVEGIEAVRQDLPIELEDGRSSFRATIQPVFMGFADLLFKRAGAAPPAERAAYLRRIRDVLEIVHQAELQDYLRDRCEVEAIQATPRASVGAGVAILYPVVFPDRVELLLETERAIAWRTTRIPAPVLRLTASQFARDLRHSETDYLPAAQQLYRWLVEPFEEVFRAEAIDTLVAVPEGPLRLISFAALHDGERFAIERFAIGTITGQTMTSTEPVRRGRRKALVAGMSMPGGVVDKLPPALADAILGESGGAGMRSAELRQKLALPAVKDEVDSVARIVDGREMLDEDFTASRFQAAARSGDYGIVHIASHGVFGGSADASYIMAYDDLLTMGRLQALLQNERLRRNPIDLLTLSACETAEGDDRSPLGISGVAVRARARSVLGTLWPVEDTAAREAMETFYRSLVHDAAGKARALQRAQLDLLRKRATAHPFFWAPFVLIGNWL